MDMDITNLQNVPKSPGVYLWKNKYGTVIYVGKAKNLSNRMKQYFKGMTNSYKTSTMVENIADFEYVITTSDKEALILERNLIEKYAPEYNIKLTDDKRYPYIMVALKDKLEVSLIYRMRSSRNKKAVFYGPFPTGYGARRMANLIARLTTYDKGLPIRDGDKAMWEEKFKYAKTLLSSGSHSLMKELETKMFEAAEKQQYEVAHDIKESIKALDFYENKQNVEISPDKNIDVIAFVEKDGFLSISMLFYRQGMLLSKNDKIVEITNSVEETTRQYLSQYYSFNIAPDEIYSNLEVETDLKLVVPKIAQGKKIVNIAIANASDNIELKMQEFVRKEEITIGAMRKLEELLGLKNISHILMIDNSNTNNTQPVSAIVSYRNGIKQKHEYRKYNLDTNDRLADVDYMNQGVTKYFGNEKNVIPDLFIVDGGVAQINEVKPLIPNVNVIGLVKNDKHQTEALINLEGQRVEIKDRLLKDFLKGIQIEVDRFAKMAHTRRRTTTLEGILGTVEGIGPATEQRLVEHFKTYAAIYNATQEQLEEVVSTKIAKAIRERLEK